jgi:PAS domain S-box-containing protein
VAQDRIADLERENDRLRREMERLGARSPASAGLSGDLESVIRGLPLLVFLLDAENRYLDYRAGGGVALYAPPESFLGRRLEEVIPEPLAGRFRAALERARASGTHQTVEYSLEMPAGPRRFEARIVSLANGRVAALVTDVTDHWRTEEALRRSEERFRAAFENAPIGMALVGLDERILDANASLCAMLGHPRERLLRMTVPEITHPEDAAAEARQKQVLLGGGRSFYRMEKRYLHADGHVVWGQLSVTAVPGEDGKPRHFVGQLEDITERKLAEEALRRSEERFRELTERATDVLVTFDADIRITHWSTGAAEALGWSAEEVLGNDARGLVHPDDGDAAARALEELARAPGAVVPVVVRVRRRDGSWRLLDAACRNLLHLPAVRSIVVNARDVTRQRQLEEQVQASQRLESIGRLAGGVAHDFNNLLTVILSCAEGLGRDLGEGHPGAEDVREIRDAGERARDLTRQLLAFARRQLIAPAVLDLNDLVRDSEKLLRRVLGEDVDLAVQLTPELWPVRCDPAQIQQVILNLAVNARDAMPRGGKLTIETSNLVLDEQHAAAHPGVSPGPHVLLAVSDSGEGMTPEARAHLFEPFFTTKPMGQGTGLGLATVYGIVRQSGGHVWVYSEPGRGTTFKIHFPRTEVAEAATAPPPRPPRTSGGKETVLVVEDDPRVREVTVRALRGAGYRVLAAGDGREALAVASAADGPVHLLVTDVVMPERSGRQVAEELGRRLPALRVLFVSGYTQNTIVHHGVLDAGVEFLPKPFTPSVLLARVREVLDRE